MTLAQAIWYGLVQGLGEFLPISSSAHLTLLPWAAGWRDPGLAFDVALHIGTLVALIIYFRDDLLALARAFLASLRERRIAGHPERKLAWLVVIGSIPGAAIGFLLEHQAEELFRPSTTSARPVLYIAGAMVVLGLLLYAADQLGRALRPIDSLTVRDALLIGLAQACAVFPGVSRSGSTITAARALGMDRQAAARFSFLLSAPIVAGAGLVKVPRLIKEGGFDATVGIAVVVAGITGYLAIGVLLRLVRTRSYFPFVVYRILFGAGVVALYFARI